MITKPDFWLKVFTDSNSHQEIGMLNSAMHVISKQIEQSKNLVLELKKIFELELMVPRTYLGFELEIQQEVLRMRTRPLGLNSHLPVFELNITK